MYRQRSSPPRLESSSVTFGCLYQDCEGLWRVGHRRSISYRPTTSLITHRDHVSHAPGLFYRMRKSSTPPHSIHVWLVQFRGATHLRAFSFSLADADADLAMLSCTTFSLFISRSRSHAARITQVHPSCDPTLRSRSAVVRLIRSSATTPHIVMLNI